MKKLWPWEPAANLTLSAQSINELARYARLLIGFSGGLDSTVLLHQLALNQRVANKLTAVHINHGLSLNATRWEEHCTEVCNALGVPLIIRRVECNSKANIEASARTARYEAFASLLDADHALLLAHHGDDQAETLLLNLLRGSGVDGLAAMPSQRPFAKGMLLRPLLQHTRQQLEDYAKLHSLTWIEDESNQDTELSRNYLRQHILPELTKRWPSVASNLQRTAYLCQQAQANLIDLAEIDCLISGIQSINSNPAALHIPRPAACPRDPAIEHNTKITHTKNHQTSYYEQATEHSHFNKQQKIKYPVYKITHHTSDIHSPTSELVLTPLYKLEPRRLINVLRHWFKQNAIQLPSTHLVHQLANAITHTDEQTFPSIIIDNKELKRYQNKLYWRKNNPSSNHPTLINWTNFPNPLRLNEHQETLYATPANEGILIPNNSQLTIRYRQGGERVQWHRQSKQLKHLFQQWQIPPWERNSIPLLYINDELVAVIGYAISDGCFFGGI